MATASAELATTLACPIHSATPIPTLGEIVIEGLSNTPKTLPPWLFYDRSGSLLFEEITRLPEYYLTRLEREIFRVSAPEMMDAAADGKRLRIIELGAGSADKTRLILAAAAAQQGTLEYCPVDVSVSALEAARERLEQELPAVSVAPLVADYTNGLRLQPVQGGERRLVLFIGSSIGNFLPDDALKLLSGLRGALEPGDGLLLGIDLAPSAGLGGKSEAELISAYDDAVGVTAEFNKNLLVRLNRELGMDFDLTEFGHQIRWNAQASRIEMHLESLRDQIVQLGDREFAFSKGETIHTENSYKYRRGEVLELLRAAGFEPVQRWLDPDGWFAVFLAAAGSR